MISGVTIHRIPTSSPPCRHSKASLPYVYTSDRPEMREVVSGLRAVLDEFLIV